MTRSSWYLAAFTILCVLAAILLPAMPQPLDYHRFADTRSMLGIANFLDVASNVGFLLFGVAGLVIVFRTRTAFVSDAERWPYAVFFVGLTVTAAGSAYYHLAPDNERLFWDRLPMTIAFMSLIAAQIADRIDVKAGLVSLLPLLIVGAASVVYWRMTERAGAGNVMPYGILQGYAIVLLVLLAAAYPSRYTRGDAIYWIFAAYILAKILEYFDHGLFALGGIISGHSLKHLAAAASGYFACRMLMLRTPIARS